MIEEEKELYVLIDRGAKSTECSSISIEQIRGVHWDDTGGGINRRQGGNSLYGYINYDLAADLVNCSGNHGYFGNGAKVRILSVKKGSKYYEGYMQLREIAGEKPLSRYGKHMPKRMLAILKENGPMNRWELCDALVKMGCSSGVFYKNVNRLVEEGKIKCTGSNKSCYQIIELADGCKEK